MLVLCLCMYELWMSGGKGGIFRFHSRTAYHMHSGVMEHVPEFVLCL